MSAPTVLEAFFPLLTASERSVRKAWGLEYWLANKEYCLKLLAVNPGFRCSLHAHPVKTETFIALYGDVRLELEDHEPKISDPDYSACLIRNLRPGQKQYILPGVRHRFSSENGALILEVSTHHEDSDVVRFEPSGPIPPEVEAVDANAPGNPVQPIP